MGKRKNHFGFFKSAVKIIHILADLIHISKISGKYILL